MPESDHDELVRAAENGQADAIEALLERHLPGLLAYVRLHAGAQLVDRESCSDLAQSVCREVLENATRFEFRGEAPFRKWLFATAMSKITDRQRYWYAQCRSPVGERHLDDSADAGARAALASFCTPSRVAVDEEDLARVERMFAALPEDYRRVITLSRIIGCSHAEVAAEMGRGEGAVRMLLSRALARLAYLLDQERQQG